MESSTLDDLPVDSQRTGWPWTEESIRTANENFDATQWPTISIITPSFDQGEFIEETIRSVLLQGYPCIEYIIVDGSSSDESVEVIKRYDKWIAYWVSEKDKGQANAINKGLRRASGDIIAWLNSDDYYNKDVFWHVAEHYLRKKEPVFWLATAVEFLDENTGNKIIARQPHYSHVADLIPSANFIHTAGVFWERSALSRFGYMDENLHYGFDKEYWMRMLAGGCSYSIDNDIVGTVYRFHKRSKSVSLRLAFKYEWAMIALRYSKAAGLTRTARRDTKLELVHSAIRLAQDPDIGVFKRVRWLLQALRCDASVLFRRDFIGTLARILGGKLARVQ